MASSTAKPHFNLVTPEALQDPFPLYKEMREQDPVHWSDVAHGWIITRYDDVMNCFRDPRLSINRTAFYEGQLGGMGKDLIREFVQIAQRQMTSMDGMEHLRLRRQANPGFSPQALDAWRPAIRNIMKQLLDGVRARSSMDLATEISYQLPTRVIAELLGVPIEHREQFQQWADPIADFAGAAVDMDPVEAARMATKAMLAMREYLLGAIKQRRETPTYDLISRMVQVQEGGAMSQDELVANLILFLVAGHLTTTDQLSNGVHTLLKNPDQLRKLRDNPALTRSTVEEIMRFSPALPFILRVAIDTFVLRGRTIKKGDLVFLGMAAANRDPQVFPDPDRFDITRDHQHQKHMTFGFGAHHCLGAGLARREIEIALEELLQGLPDMRLDDTKQPQLKCHTLLFRGFQSLPVQW